MLSCLFSFIVQTRRYQDKETFINCCFCGIFSQLRLRLIIKKTGVLLTCNSKNCYNRILSRLHSALSYFLLLLLLFSSSAFLIWLRGQQLQIKPPQLSINQHRLHFAWIKSQTVPTKILDIIEPFCLWSSNWPLPTHFSI